MLLLDFGKTRDEFRIRGAAVDKITSMIKHLKTQRLEMVESYVKSRKEKVHTSQVVRMIYNHQGKLGFQGEQS